MPNLNEKHLAEPPEEEDEEAAELPEVENFAVWTFSELSWGKYLPGNRSASNLVLIRRHRLPARRLDNCGCQNQGLMKKCSRLGQGRICTGLQHSFQAQKKNSSQPRRNTRGQGKLIPAWANTPKPEEESQAWKNKCKPRRSIPPYL